MTLVRSFPPIAGRDARILILGSMPGADSLRATQYYANPRNQFWRIMGELFQAGPNIDYLDRCDLLKRAGVAVWDVIQECYREGSLDSSITDSSIRPNNFTQFFEDHQKIEHIYFNGAKAEHCFSRYARPAIKRGSFLYTRLPSTSPANASLNFEKKLALWRIITDLS